MNAEKLKSAAAQTLLTQAGFYQGTIDGIWGNVSKDAAREWLRRQQLALLARMQPASRQLLSGIPSNEVLRTLAAQVLLKDLGIYGGKIDGIWGPASTSAVEAWGVVIFPPAPQSPISNPTPYQIARQHIGVREIPGKKHNGTILNWLRKLQVSVFDDETPWCSTFVNYCALEAGYERTGKLNARSWLHDVGLRIARPDDAREGDVIIFERGTSGWEGHVAFLVSLDLQRRTARCLGGNQADEVNISTYSLSKLLGIRRLRSLDQLQGASNKI